MIKKRIINKGDVYWLNPNPTQGRELKDQHRFIVITPAEINALGIVMMIPVTSAGVFARNTGLTVPITGHDTSGVAICNQVRSFDLEERIKDGSANYIETINRSIIDEIVLRVISIIDPE